MDRNITNLRFGKRPPIKDYRTLLIQNYLRDDIPTPPDSFDSLKRVYENIDPDEPTELFPMLGNDEVGNCLSPETRILTDKLEWIPIKDIRVGDRLIGFDEIPKEYNRRRFCVTTVESTMPLLKQCYDLKFSDGTQIRASYDHLWLRNRRGKDAWLKTESMIVGDKKTSSVAKCFDVWEKPSNIYDIGYLSAALDGEGCLSIDYSKGGHLKSVHFSQRPNEMLFEVKRILTELGFEFVHSTIKYSSLSNEGYDVLSLLGGRKAACKLLGSVRPKRLISKFDGDLLGAIRSNRIDLIEKTDVGEQTVIAIQTSSRTFIAEGIASHNCTIAGMAHADTVWSALVGNKSIYPTELVKKIYFHLTGGDDAGLAMLTVLDYFKKNYVAGEKIYAYMGLNPHNHTHVKQAIVHFGGIFLGFQVHQKCIEEFIKKEPWQPGLLLNSGHAVFATGYDENGLDILTWGDIQRGTWEWWDWCVDEAYVILPPEASNPKFMPGIDFEKLKRDLVTISHWF